MDSKHPPIAEAAPDWTAVEQDIFCPLCGYNLRGLETPRCPECGYRFSWRELFESREKQHPYLFEHHPKHNAWSFFRTLTGGLRPRRFWTDLHAGHEVCPRRLLAYALIITLAVLLLGSAWTAVYYVQLQYQRSTTWRQRILAGYGNPDPNVFVMPDGTLMADHFKLRYPLPPQPRFFAGVLSHMYQSRSVGIVALLAAWPWLTFLVLNLFVWSMFRANVYPRHVFRCVTYSGDALIWIVLLCIALIGAAILSGTVGFLFILSDVGTVYIILVMLVLIAVAIYRLACAYRRYLRFPHAWATVLASQLIAGLTLFTLFIYLVTPRL